MYMLFLLMFAFLLMSPVLAVWMTIGLLFVLPLLALFHSIHVLVAVPLSLWQTFTDNKVRKNHALEHATANVLEERYRIKVGGMAFKNGFQLYGPLPSPAVLTEAAREALTRLRNGETSLALHPRCGTSLAVGQFLNALVFLIVFLFMHHFTLVEILIYLLFSMLLAQPLGLLTQKYLTTCTEVDDIELLQLSVNGYGQVFFHTGEYQPRVVFWPGFERFFRPFHPWSRWD